ncbi:phosphoribosylformylglycinamidine cyclo-ligase, partial [Candidatus Micrarchaeota archaeon]|nr:phosphoribosylformylglycinamidine cyclo-ligase [Candidatus Micrarchaeota archaeon]
MSFTYAKAGVNVAKIKGIQGLIQQMTKKTKNKYMLPIYGHYAGLLKIKNQQLALHTDSAGTKVLVAQYLGKYDTIGIDAVAMNVNDIICIGANPIALLDYLALEKDDESLVYEIMKGLVKGAREAKCSIVGGETAIMPDVIKGLEGKTGFDLACTCLGILEKKITGSEIREGDLIIGLRSSGLHSNAYSLARKVLPLGSWAKELLTPTKIYVKPIMQTVKKLRISGLANITGGAFSKLTRLNQKHGFLLHSMPEPNEIFEEIQKRAKLSDREMYRTFN